MTDPTAAEPIKVPGVPAPPLDALLRIDHQPEVRAKLASDLAAIRDAERCDGVDRYAPIGLTHTENGWDRPRYEPGPFLDPAERLPYRSDGIDWGDPINGLLAGGCSFGGLGIVGVLALVVVVITGG